MGRPYTLLLLAQAYEGLDQTDKGLKTIAEALRTVRHTGEEWITPELYRVKGEALRQKATTVAFKESESCFQKSLDMARKQQAKAWELRAAISLSRLWQQREKTTRCPGLAERHVWLVHRGVYDRGPHSCEDIAELLTGGPLLT